MNPWTTEHGQKTDTPAPLGLGAPSGCLSGSPNTPRQPIVRPSHDDSPISKPSLRSIGSAADWKAVSRRNGSEWRASPVRSSLIRLTFRNEPVAQPGKAFPLIWTDKNGRPEASIEVRIEKVSPVHRALVGLLPAGSSVPDRLQAVLQYSVRRAPDDVRPITDIIVLAQSPRGFAGQSWRFCCPGCTRRVADLYPTGAYFRCRKCCGVGYRSQRQTRVERGLEKAARIRRQLGGAGEYGEGIPERPKGMHFGTYLRLLERLAEAEDRGTGE